MSGMRARGWRRQGGAMDVTLGVRPGDDGTVVAVSGEVDVCTEAPLQQALLRIMREHGARLLLDVSGVSFMDCAGLRALAEPIQQALHRQFGQMLLARGGSAVPAAYHLIRGPVPVTLRPWPGSTAP